MRRVVRGGAGLVLLLLVASPAKSADPTVTTITSSGPLTRVAISTELNCQVAHAGDAGFEFFDPTSTLGACGTFLALEGTLYGPSSVASAPIATTGWTAVSQSPVGGSGTDADPLRITTVVDAGASGLRLEEIDSYVLGRESYRTDVRITNQSGGQRRGVLYRAGDCFLQDSDTGYGRLEGGAPACLVSQSQGTRVEQWLPLTPGSAATEDEYGTVWTAIGQQKAFSNSCACGQLVDNGGGLSWEVTLPDGGQATFSHLTLFSPEGRRPLATRLAAASASAQAGGRDGYTLSIENPNSAPVQLDGLFVELPAGFRYAPSSTQGTTTADPTIAGRRLTWAGSYSVPASGTVTLHFDVLVASAAGDYRAAAGATSPTDTVASAEAAAAITVGVSVSQPMRQSVPSPTAISLDPVVIAESAAIAVGVVALVPFPSALFNSTLEQHYEEVMAPIMRLRATVGPMFSPIAMLWTGARRLSRRRRGVAADAPVDPIPFFATPFGILLFIGLSAVLYGLLDPSFGLSTASLGTFAGIFIGLVITLLLFGIPYARALQREGVRIVPRALPGTLAVGLGCVLISRLTGFQPGYLYGLVIGFVVSRHLTHAEEGRSLALATAAALAGSVVAWLLLTAVRAAAPATAANPSLDDPGYVAAVIETACVTVVVAGLETAVFGLMPIRFLPGEKVFAYHRLAWLVLLGLGTFAFCHVILNPSSGYLADTTRVSLLTTVALLAFFGLGSIAFWGYFRYRSRATRQHPPGAEPPVAPAPPV